MKSFSSAIRQMSLDEALDMVEQNADQEWMKNTLEQVRILCTTHTSFTTDDVWELVEETREPRALGAIIREAASRGWCVPSGQYVKSKRKECHSRPIAVWNSRPL